MTPTNDQHGLSVETVDLLERKGLLGPADLAGYLGVPLATIYRWNAAGQGPPFMRLGKHCRYRPTDVAEWLEQHAHEKAA